MKANLPDPKPGTEHLCNGRVDCWDAIPRPCVRPKGHTGGCNPFSDTDHSQDAKPVDTKTPNPNLKKD
jgi:hypothetical protein